MRPGPEADHSLASSAEVISKDNQISQCHNRNLKARLESYVPNTVASELNWMWEGFGWLKINRFKHGNDPLGYVQLKRLSACYVLFRTVRQPSGCNMYHQV